MNEYDGPPRRHDPADDDERMRRLLDDAVSDIEPGDALGAIHTRTKVSTMKRKQSWFLGAGAAVAAVAATVVAVTVLSGDGTQSERDPDVAAPTASADPDEPTEDASPDQSASPDVTTPAMQTVPVYYPGETSRGVRLFREFHRLEIMEDDIVSAAVDEAVSATPDDPDYRTDWPEGTSAARVQDPGTPDVLTIDVTGGAGLHDRPGPMSEEQAQLAIEQVVYTAQAAAQARDAVQFLLNGERTDSLLGVPVSEPLAQGDPVDVLAQVWIIDPAEGTEVSAPFTVSGLAAAFEANVLWELRQGDEVVRSDFTTAEECCTMAPYSFEVDAPPGDYTLVVQDSDPSGGEGPSPWQDTKNITVLP